MAFITRMSPATRCFQSSGKAAGMQTDKWHNTPITTAAEAWMICFGNSKEACLTELEPESLKLLLIHHEGKRLVQALPRSFGSLKVERKLTENSRKKKGFGYPSAFLLQVQPGSPAKVPCFRGTKRVCVGNMASQSPRTPWQGSGLGCQPRTGACLL